MTNVNFLPRARTIDVYSSPTTHFIVGSVGSGLFRVLFFERTEDFASIHSLKDVLFSDPKLYDLARLTKLLRTPTRRTTQERRNASKQNLSLNDEDPIREHNSVPVHQFRAQALLGVFRFLQGFYLLFCTERKRIGYLNGHVIYSVQATRLLPVCGFEHASPDTSAWTWLTRRNTQNPILEQEERYLSLFQLVDLTKGDFFFSYTLDLSNPLQSSLIRGNNTTVSDAFVWNDFQTKALRDVIILDDQQPTTCSAAEARLLLYTSDSWILPLIHGSFQQQTCVLFGRTLTLTLLARRSRHFAGTRFLKRGVNDRGEVANMVEVEQIVEMDQLGISSFTQVRGSIPVFWAQETSLSMPKPAIRQYRHDPAYKSTRLHFTDLFTRYGTPISVLNLVRQQEGNRECEIGREFAHAVDLLNVGLVKDEQIQYHALDYKALFSKKKGTGNGDLVLGHMARQVIARCGVFFVKALTASNSTMGMAVTFQRGTARTNCIDNLDRTNAAQYMIGQAALREQLRSAGLDAEHFLSGRMAEVFLEMFDALGDRIAQQYGGSQAHKKSPVTTSTTASAPVASMTGGGNAGAQKHQTFELLTSMRRYYSNSFTDRAKQDAINLFLGCYVPREHTEALWDMDTDFYLHNFAATDKSSLLPSESDIDVGTQRWWVAETAATVPNQQVALHSALWDEEDTGFYVQFDRVFADEFFRPVQIAPATTTVANNIAANLPATPPDSQRRRVSGGGGDADSSDDEGGGVSIRQVAQIKAANATAQVLLLPPATTASVLRNITTTREPLPECEATSLAAFRQAELLSRHADQVFARREVDPAFLEHCEDMTIDPSSLSETLRIQSKYATTQVLPEGHVFSGMNRGMVVKDLYTLPNPTGALYSFQVGDSTLTMEYQKELAIFKNAVAGDV